MTKFTYNLVKKGANSSSVKIIEHRADEFRTPVLEVKPLSNGCPAWLSDKYKQFKPHYHDKLKTFKAKLCNIVRIDQLGRFVGVYHAQVFDHTGHYYHDEYFVWVWRDGMMQEMHQDTKAPDGRRELDVRRTLLANM